MENLLARVFPNDPGIGDEMEGRINLYVALLVAVALGFLLFVRKSLGSAAM